MDWPFKAFTLTLITLSLLVAASANCVFDGCEPTFSNVTYQNFNENYSNLFDNNHNLFFELNSLFKNNLDYKTFEVKAYAPLKKTSSKIDFLESRYVPVTTVDTSSEDNTDTSSEDNTDTSSEDNTDTSSEDNTDTSSEDNTDTSSEDNTDTSSEDNTDTSSEDYVYLPSKITQSPKTSLYIIKTTQEPVVEEPVVEEPVVEEPVVEEPVVEEPVVEEPVVDKNSLIEQYILDYTNIERSSYGLDELILDSKLSQISQAHSDDMVENDYFSHVNLDGETPTDRAIAADYNVVKYLGDGYYATGIGENIAKMPTGNVIGIGYVSDDAESIAKAIVDAWMDSPGHRANILNSQYTNMGIGVSFDGTYYVATQNFY
ncbi:Allergen V5/Tpx-1 family protein [Methanococcus maripaludis C5]|uniref:Allergen V5/Tpx-1 family protein n=1 Tax=Methanococcus maripaludis (strain C5 / ATCC BAA-1333) TaxID=402880 RepID=A4FW86_METM5|nr:CAP domain-containing protein [Methanococcus maripaludis]ABO34457.1 Allergen V5/Tpx-1 family protein [Methanococcus maripaludis C5]